MHQRRAAADPLPAVNPVAQIGVQTPQAQDDERQRRRGRAGDQGYQGLPPVRRDMGPGGVGRIPEGVRQPVIVPLVDELGPFLEGPHLLPNHLFFLVRAFPQVHLVPEGAAHSRHAPGFHRRIPARLPVGHSGDVGPHGADGIAEGGAALDAQAVDGVGIVAAPDLRGIVEHPRVKPPAAAAASLDEQVRIIPAEPLQQVVDPQHVPMVYLPLPSGGDGGGPHVGEGAVHVPLQIGDAGAVQDAAHGGIDVVPDLLPGEVKHQLAPPLGLGAVGGPQGPVRMGPIQLAVLADHFRLHPDAELHPQLPDAGGQGLQAAGELLLVDRPVPQAAEVAVALAEPAVVHDEQLHAQRCPLPGDGGQLFLVKMELRGLPVVDKHRAALSSIGVPDELLPDGPVEAVGHGGQAVGGADQGRLRGGKALPGGQGPAEVVGMDAHHQPGVVKLAALRRRQKIAAVQQGRAVADPVVLPGVMVAEDDEGVVLVAGGPPDAAHALLAGAQGGAVQVPLLDVSAVEGDEVQVRPVEVQAQAHNPAQGHRFGPPVGQPYGPGDEVVRLVHAVQQLRLHPGAGVPQRHRQRLPSLAEEGGQALQGVFPRQNGVTRVPQVQQQAAVGLLHLGGVQAEVPHPAGGVLLGQGVQGVGPVLPGAAGVGGETPVRVLEEAAQVRLLHPGAVIEVEQHPTAVRLHLIGGAPGVEGKGPVLFIIKYHRAVTLCREINRIGMESLK